MTLMRQKHSLCYEKLLHMFTLIKNVRSFWVTYNQVQTDKIGLENSAI